VNPAAPNRKKSPDDGRTPELARAAARARWGAPRSIRLDGLNDGERQAIVDLVSAILAGKAVAP